MGMFDTIMLTDALECPHCGFEETAIQTHELGNSLAYYRFGMILPFCPVLTGVIRETFWCSKCHHKDHEKAPELFVVIWHTILVGVVWTEEEADRLLQSVDRLSLVEWLDQMQAQAQQWQRQYHALRSDLDRWHKYVTEEQDGHDREEPVQRSPLRKWFWPHEDIRNADDPLDAILKRNP